jgi:hypothetical protein
MAEGHGWGGTSCAGSNHPALASASAAPPYPRRGALSGTYVAVYSLEDGFELSRGVAQTSCLFLLFADRRPKSALRSVPG